MEWSKKIDLKKYVFGTGLALCFAVYSGGGKLWPTLLLGFVVVASALNQWLWFKILNNLLKRMQSNGLEQISKKRMVFEFCLKWLIIAASFYLLITYARAKIVQGLILYTFQLIILILSIKNVS